MAALVRVGRTQERLRSVGALFRDLSIEHQVVKGKDFWEANRAQLPELREELVYESRIRMAELHPDRENGDEEQFKLFTSAVRAALARFKRALGGEEAPSSGDLIVLPRGVGRTYTGGIKRQAESMEIARQLRDGATFASFRKRGISHYRLTKILKAVQGRLAPCGCGRPARHTGTCSVRVKAA